jgi:2-amino-4-hydroxy-6-hydroxymethyldihydropteridine diphosphokinase
LYASRPTERPEQADFINGVWEIETDRDAWSLKFDVLREVERRVGRVRGPDKHAARPLDLDLLLYGHQVIRSDELAVPDPDIYNASYVTFPLAELAPTLVLPDTKIRIKDLAGAADTRNLTPLPALTAALKGWLNP